MLLLRFSWTKNSRVRRIRGASARQPQPQLITIHSGLGLPDKGRAIKGFVVCLLRIVVRIFKGLVVVSLAQGTWGLIPCCGQDGYLAQVPQHPLEIVIV